MILRSPTSGKGIRINGEFEARLGFRWDELAELPLLHWIHPEDRDALSMLINTGEGHIRARHRDSDGAWVCFDWKVKTNAGEVVALGLAAEAEDGEELGSVDRRTTPGTTLKATLTAMVEIVESKNPGLRCSILLLDEERTNVSVGAGPSLPAEYNAAVEGLQIGPRVGSCGTAAYWNVPVVVENIFEDPLWTDLREAAKLAGVAACWSQPITTMSGEVLGAMALYNDEPRAPEKHHMDGLEIAARMVGLAIERDRLEDQLRQAAKLEALGVLAGGIAHDFNNLLAAILGNAELAATTLDENARANVMLGEIITASVNATELCSQMLAYAGRSTPSTEPIDCNEVVRELGGLLKVALSKKAQLIYELSSAPSGVLGDKSQLRQVIMNLITNASDAIGNHEGQIVIRTSVQELDQDELKQRHPEAKLSPGTYVYLTVTDTGKGMNGATKARIFDPFFSTKTSGRGLGLAAVQGIVRGHEGAIGLESEEGGGTVFSVLLPFEELPHESVSNHEDTKSEAQGARILVVDDEAQIRAVVGSILERAGYEILLAGDGVEALEIFRRESDSIDCVLLDLSMPKLDGDEVFAQLREIRGDVRVILSSGFAEQEILNRFKDAGLAGVIQKPARMNVLLAKVGEALR